MNQWDTSLEIAKKINNNRKFSNGDALTAADLNVIVENLLIAIERLNDGVDNSSLVEQYFADAIGTLAVSWQQSAASLNTKTFSINLNGSYPFYSKLVINHDKLSGTCTSTTTNITVTINETQTLRNSNGSGCVAYSFYLEIYSDAALTKLIYQNQGTIYYYLKSTTPSGD